MSDVYPSPKIRVLLADDHPMMLMGIKAFLSTQEHIEVAGEATDGEETLQKARELRPDIVVMDVSMPGADGFEVAAQLREEFPEIKVVILSMHDEREYISQFVSCGAAGYVIKKGSPEELLQAIESVNKGGAYFSPEIAMMVLKTQREAVALGPEVTLSPREVQVLKLLAKGRSTKEIAEDLLISTRTVSKYREIVMDKLEIHTIAGLTQYALSRKLINSAKS